MENALLYTFSTIAQALGGAIALLSAFVLYRMQSLDPLMWQDSALLSHLASGPEAHILLEQRRAQGAWTDILKDAKKVAEDRTHDNWPAPYGPPGEAPFLRFAATIIRHQAISARFKTSAWVTGAVMLGSVALIPFAHSLAPYCVLAWIVAVPVGAGSFGLCLWLYWRVISLALGFTQAIW